MTKYDDTRDPKVLSSTTVSGLPPLKDQGFYVPSTEGRILLIEIQWDLRLTKGLLTMLTYWSEMNRVDRTTDRNLMTNHQSWIWGICAIDHPIVTEVEMDSRKSDGNHVTFVTRFGTPPHFYFWVTIMGEFIFAFASLLFLHLLVFISRCRINISVVYYTCIHLSVTLIIHVVTYNQLINWFSIINQSFYS